MRLVATHELPEVVRFAVPLIRDALNYDDDLFTVKDVLDELLSGRAQLWVGERSVMVTNINRYPKGPVLAIWLGSGDKDEMYAALPAITEWAKRTHRCVVAEWYGRLGFLRDKTARSHGFEPQSVILRKFL